MLLLYVDVHSLETATETNTLRTPGIWELLKYLASTREITNSKWDFCNISKLTTDKARGGKRNDSVLEGLHCIYGKPSIGHQENDVQILKLPVLGILNTSLPLD